MTFRKLFAGLTLVAGSLPAYAEAPVPSLGGRPAIDLRGFDDRAGTDDYRLGDEWGKKPVTTADLADPVFARAAKAAARVGSATGFYLGVFDGQHVVATNHHVCPRATSCVNTTVRFPMLDNMSFQVTKMYGTWTDIDLALLRIDVRTTAQADKLAAVAGNFAFRAELTPGQPLVTVGFGVAGNTLRQMVANRDADCRVHSAAGEYRFMADPDAFNPGPYRAWSFANGCDVSHGDSGSAMVDRVTGEVVGIIWTGKVPKERRVQSSQYLDELLATPGEDVWTELSYAVPAAKVGEHLASVAANPSTAADVRRVLSAIVAE